MKYRTDFVTNSSSTSFGAASGSIIAAIIGILATLCPKQPEEEEKNKYIQTTVMPEGEKKITAGSNEPVWLYAQFVEIKAGESVINPEITDGIEFSIEIGKGWVSLGEKQKVEDWVAIDIYGVTPNEVTSNPPGTIKIRTQVVVGKKKYKKIVTFTYEAEPKLVITPDRLNFLSKTGEILEAKVIIANPGSEQWSFEVEMDSDVQKLCGAILEEDPEKPNKPILKITEADTYEPTGRRHEYYDYGKIIVKAISGEKEISDYLTVTVYREGIFIDSLLDPETNAVKIEANLDSEGKMKTTELDILYLRWNPENRNLSANPEALKDLRVDDIIGDDEGAERVLDLCEFKMEFDRVRPSNLSTGVFKMGLDKICPGRSDERFHATLDLELDTDEEVYKLTVPIIIKPAFLADTNVWKEEYDNCVRIINTYIPDERRSYKLIELEKNKFYMGTEDLKRFRWECWNIARDAIVNEGKIYLDKAAWYDKIVYTLEWTSWLGDRAFAVVVSTLMGPIGSYAVTQIKESIVDLLVKIQEAEGKDWYTFLTEYLSSRFQGVVGGGIDAVVTAEPEASIKWVTSFYLYKFVWHWYWDVEANGTRKGVFEAVKSAAWDLTALGIEKALEPYIKDSALKKGWAQSDKIDEYVKAVIEKVKFAISMLGPEIMP